MGIAGASGAGKSTACRELAATRADLIHGDPVFVEDFTVAENIWLGAEPGRLGLVDQADTATRTRALLARFGSRIHPHAPVAGLSGAERRIVEMARAVRVGTGPLVLDEPAENMAWADMEVLLAAVRQAARNGVAVAYASRRVCELALVADQVAVVRSGRAYGPYPVRRGDAVDLAAKVFGVEVRMPVGPPAPREEDVLRVSELRAGPMVEDMSFTVAAGEVVALIGPGAGEAVKALLGLVDQHSGEVLLYGQPTRFRRPRNAARAGVGYLLGGSPEPGLRPHRTVGTAVAAADPDRPRISRGHRRHVVRLAETLLNTELPAAGRLVGTLSPDERRRVALARCLLAEFEVLLLVEPTTGLPAAARDEIHRIVRELAHAGVAIVLTAGVVPDVLDVADRVVLVRAGRTVCDLPVPGLSTQDVLEMSAGRAPLRGIGERRSS
ncbi:sugar ABC transporter ATP-binding protein [Kibdelosporangium lantanae]